MTEPLCCGAVELAARGGPGGPVASLALAWSDDGRTRELVAGDERRLHATTLEERPPRPQQRPRDPALSLGGGGRERILAVGRDGTLVVTAWSRDDGDEIVMHSLPSRRREVVAGRQRRAVAAALGGDSLLVWSEDGGVLRSSFLARGVVSLARAMRPEPGRRALVDVADDGRTWLVASGPVLEVRRRCDEEPIATIDLGPLGSQVHAVLFASDELLFVATDRGEILRFSLTIRRVGTAPEARLAAIVDAVDVELAGRTWSRTHPRVQVYDARGEGARVVQYFVADRRAVLEQAGEAWYLHELADGHAVFEADRVVEVEVRRARPVTRVLASEPNGHEPDAALEAHRARLARERSSSTLVPGALAIQRAFDEAFGSDHLRFLERALHHAAGTFDHAGWEVRYRFGQEGGVAYADVLLSHRRTNDRLHRVWASGQVDEVGASTEGVLPDVDAAFEREVRERFSARGT